MTIRELPLDEIEDGWSDLAPLLGHDDAALRLDRLRQLLVREGSYAIALETPQGRGFAACEHYESSWIFEERIASLREFAVSEPELRIPLLRAIEQRARDAGMSHLSRYLSGDDPDVAWWLQGGFVEYMAAFRRPIDEDDGAGTEAGDGLVIREVRDIDSEWPKLWPLIAQLDEHHASLTGSALRERREETARGGLQQEIDAGEALVMLAEDGDRAVATSTAELGEAHADGTRTGYRSRLFIEPAYRGRSLSGRFEARALQSFRAHGVTHVERWIVAGNERPREIWSARGFLAERLLLRKALKP